MDPQTSTSAPAPGQPAARVYTQTVFGWATVLAGVALVVYASLRAETTMSGQTVLTGARISVPADTVTLECQVPARDGLEWQSTADPACALPGRKSGSDEVLTGRFTAPGRYRLLPDGDETKAFTVNVVRGALGLWAGLGVLAVLLGLPYVLRPAACSCP